MSGETNLSELLKLMKPELNAGYYVFCTTNKANLITDKVICLFLEKEGWSVVLERSEADSKKLHYSGVFAWITLNVHSSLEAKGLTAAFSTALANANISCNVVAAFYHDHIFVPKAEADRAMEVLTRLTQ